MCGDVALTDLFIQQKQVEDSRSLKTFSTNFLFLQNYLWNVTSCLKGQVVMVNNDIGEIRLPFAVKCEI